MPQRLFQDLVVSGAARPARGVGAALIVPQLATDLPPVAAAAPPPIPTWHRVQVVEVPPPVPPRPPVATQRARPQTVPTAPTAPTTGTGPAVPTDISALGDGEIADDSPPLCFSNCTPGDGTPGAVLPGPPTDGGGFGETVIRRAGRDVTPPAKLSGNPPAYPELARRGRVQGEVVIECTIDPSGRVVDATVSRGNPLFDEAALEAVRGWRYRPTLVDGIPVPVLMTVTVRFRIS
jgi:periplasmic protein TonB